MLAEFFDLRNAILRIEDLANGIADRHEARPAPELAERADVAGADEVESALAVDFFQPEEGIHRGSMSVIVTSFHA